MSVIYGLTTQVVTVNSHHIILQTNGRTMNEIFPALFGVFLILGTAVGVVVISYMVYNAYKYREANGREEKISDPLQLGELPRGGGGGKKLAISLTISAIIVIALIAWAYVLLVDVESGAPASEDLEIQVEGIQFAWQFEYPNGHTTSTLRVPEDQAVTLTIISGDVFHTFGVPAFDLKADAIPGQSTETWFRPNETGTYKAQCFELCGSGHSVMEAEVIVMEPNKFDLWYDQTGSETNGSATDNATVNASTTDNQTALSIPAASSQLATPLRQ